MVTTNAILRLMSCPQHEKWGVCPCPSFLISDEKEICTNFRSSPSCETTSLLTDDFTGSISSNVTQFGIQTPPQWLKQVRIHRFLLSCPMEQHSKASERMFEQIYLPGSHLIQRKESRLVSNAIKVVQFGACHKLSINT